MTEIERAIDIISTYNNTIAVNPDFECAMDAAIAALREKAEREKGCVCCIGDEPNKYAVKGIHAYWDAEINFCPMCGKRLEEHHDAD